jgi:MFS family permease
VSSVRSDLRLILWVQALRAFAYGFGVVVLGTSLASSGLSDADVTLVFTAMLAGMAIASIVVGEIGDRLGRRRLYAILLALMGVSGVVFALTNSVWLLCLVSLTGTMSTDANESGPITSIEQAMIGQASAETRIQVFGRYNAVAYLAGAMGSLAAGGPAFLRDVWHSAPSDQRWLLLFAVVAVLSVMLAMRLSPLMEVGGDRASARSSGRAVTCSACRACSRPTRSRAGSSCRRSSSIGSPASSARRSN